LVSTTSIILIVVGVTALGIAAYYTYNLLTEDSPSGALARARLGLDKRPRIGLLQDPKLGNYTADPRFGGYENRTKGIIESPNITEDFRKILKDFEREGAERYFGKANATFSSFAGLADEDHS
jgi:hypothetical protein